MDAADKAFVEVAHIIAGFISQAKVRDDAAWKLCGEISGAWFRYRGRVSEATPPGLLHPAASAMLRAIRD